MQDDQCIVNGITGNKFEVDKLVVMDKEENISFRIVGYDGLCIELQASNGKTYLLESTYEDPLQCWELPTVY